MKLNAFVAALCLFIGAPAAAEEQSAGSGEGWVSCAVFGQHYGQSPDEVRGRYFAWAQGYMTGINTALLRLNGKSQNLAIRDESGIEARFARLRFYCDQHPLAPFVAAVNDLYDSLDANMPIQNTLVNEGGKAIVTSGVGGGRGEPVAGGETGK